MHQDLQRVQGEEAAIMLREYFNSAPSGLKAAFAEVDTNNDKCLDSSEVCQPTGLIYTMALC